MPVPSAITDLSTTAASNYPAGTEAPNVIDDTLRAHGSFIRQLYDGPLIPVDGSAGAPVYAFTSDPDTGVFRPSGNAWAVATGGSERLRLDGSGNMGVGTSSPAVTAGITVAKAGASNVGVEAINTSVASVSFGYNGSVSANAWGAASGSAYFGSPQAVPLEFLSGGTTMFKIDASGNSILKVTGAAPALGVNSTMTFELTSNTSLKLSARGSDGVTRSVSLTLA